jgi:hypothetical protein
MKRWKNTLNIGKHFIPVEIVVRGVNEMYNRRNELMDK